MPELRDEFSKLAEQYAKNRPRYPAALFEHLARVTSGHELAWDCGTGSGQTAVRLAESFDQVIATDISDQQIEHARSHPRVSYRVAPSEQSGLKSGSVDIVTASQAAHWFQIDEFYREVRRVLKPGGILAIWCYGLLSVADELDRAVERLHNDLLGPYWPKRTLEDHAYADIPFPFDELPKRQFQMKMSWTLDQFRNYFRTWSASLLYLEDKGVDPVSIVEEDFRKAWGEPEKARTVTWPVYLRHGA